ncbi:MAG: LPS assembly lipoprotein LptE [Bdellovibrionales bacterium]
MFRTLLFGSLLISLALWLSACGFTPVYSKYGKENAQSALSNIEIGIIPDQEGQFLRNVLIDNFYQNGYPSNPRYHLSIEPIQERVRDLDVTITSDTTRAQLKLSTSFKVIDKQTEEEILSRNIKSITSYNVLGSEFSTRVTERNARENALIDLARQIERAITLFATQKE